VLNHLKRLLNQHLVATVAVAVTLIIYFKFMFYGHISWDDPEMVFKNDAVKTFDVKQFFSGHFVGNYIPVTMLFHAIGWLLFEDHNWGHHALNILLHLTNGVLVYQLGKHLFKNDLVATIGIIIFLLHPLQVESVGWISELKNVLSTTFYLAGMLTYLRFNELHQKKDYLFVFLFFILGCLSKSSVVVLPLSLICLDILTKQKFTRKFLINKIPFFAFSVIFGIINIQTQAADQFINHSHEFPFYQRIGFAGFALLKYIFLFLSPVNLSVIYPYPEIKAATLAVGTGTLIALTSLIITLIVRKKYSLTALVLFVLVNLLLVLQFLPFGEVLYADRYAYIPLIGFAWISGIVITRIKIQSSRIFILLISIYAFFTLARVQTWKSAISLYEDILEKYPTQFIALNSAGVESMFLNEDDKALKYFNKAVIAAPRNYKGFYNRGLLFLKNQKPELAIKSFDQALELYNYPKAYAARASAYYMLRDIPKAMNDASFVLRTDFNNPKAHFVLANCYNDLNKLDEALNEYNYCITQDKNNPDYYFKRAIVFGKKQDFNSSLNDLLLCLQLNPGYYEAYYWKGVAKINLKLDPCDDLKISAQHNYAPAISAFNKYCRN
jgi:tetratricopeptide (TPR) repeat protein